jgi:hypothetical protein
MRRFLALLAIVALGACNQEIDQSTRPDNIVGSYHLVSFGGTILPATIRADSVNLQVLDGTLTLASDGQWSETISLQVRSAGATQVQAVTSFGNWNNIREVAYISFFDKANNYQFSGTASGATIVLNTVNGEQLVYRR